ncbi:MAG: hypothetical protein MJ056_07650 [Akkermansia sp.]|nr:hypothetical protein [Akkermansia sp.]
MKGCVQATCMLAVLALCACTSARTPKADGAEAQVSAPETTAEAPALTAEEAEAESEEASTFFGRFFSRLFGGGGDKADATAVADGKPTVTTKEEVLPSPAQEEAALRMLAEQGSDANIPEPLLNGNQTGPLTMGLPTFENDGTDGMGTGSLSSARGLRAAPGLRIRNMAPPEEAISADGNSDAPKPNSAELKGLRSISLPETLPMDINGKLTKDQEKH